jgi:hypothetical protein
MGTLRLLAEDGKVPSARKRKHTLSAEMRFLFISESAGATMDQTAQKYETLIEEARNADSPRPIP